MHFTFFFPKEKFNGALHAGPCSFAAVAFELCFCWLHNSLRMLWLDTIRCHPISRKELFESCCRKVVRHLEVQISLVFVVDNIFNVIKRMWLRILFIAAGTVSEIWHRKTVSREVSIKSLTRDSSTQLRSALNFISITQALGSVQKFNSITQSLGSVQNFNSITQPAHFGSIT